MQLVTESIERALLTAASNGDRPPAEARSNEFGQIRFHDLKRKGTTKAKGDTD
jgi:hypothetical protein